MDGEDGEVARKTWRGNVQTRRPERLYPRIARGGCPASECAPFRCAGTRAAAERVAACFFLLRGGGGAGRVVHMNRLRIVRILRERSWRDREQVGHPHARHSHVSRQDFGSSGRCGFVHAASAGVSPERGQRRARTPGIAEASRSIRGSVTDAGLTYPAPALSGDRASSWQDSSMPRENGATAGRPTPTTHGRHGLRKTPCGVSLCARIYGKHWAAQRGAQKSPAGTQERDFDNRRPCARRAT